MTDTLFDIAGISNENDEWYTPPMCSRRWASSSTSIPAAPDRRHRVCKRIGISRKTTTVSVPSGAGPCG